MNLRTVEQKLKHWLMLFLKNFLKPEKIPVENIKKPKKVVVVRIDERLGNLIILLPMLKILKRNGIDTTFLTSEKFGALAKNEIEKVIFFNKKKLLFFPWKILSLYLKLRSETYDLVIDAGHAANSSVLAGLLISVLKSKVKIGFKKNYSDLSLTTQLKPSSLNLHAVTYHYMLLKNIHIKTGKIENPKINIPDEFTKKIKEKLKMKDSLQIKGPLIGIHPGARGSKDWGIDNFTNLMKMIKYKYNLNFVIIAGPQDLERVKYFTGETIFCSYNLLELGAVLKSLSALICNDSGPMHFAAAVETPIFALFKTSTYPGFYPLTDKKMIIKSEDIKNITVADAFKSFEKFMSKYIHVKR